MAPSNWAKCFTLWYSLQKMKKWTTKTCSDLNPCNLTLLRNTSSKYLDWYFNDSRNNTHNSKVRNFIFAHLFHFAITIFFGDFFIFLPNPTLACISFCFVLCFTSCRISIHILLLCIALSELYCSSQNLVRIRMKLCYQQAWLKG